jgi:2-dehydropantoate 2-reductase
MRVVMVGAGGVGGYLGVRLAAAGHEVGWLARGETLAVLREQGVVLEAPQGIVRLPPQRASDDAAALGRAEAVIVTVKLYDLAAVATRLRPLLGDDTAVLPLQNGVDAHGILAEALPGAAPLKGTVSIKSSRTAPGRIVAKSDFCRIKLGEADGRPSARIERLAAALNGCVGVSAALVPDIEAELWRKFVMLASFSAVACLARATIGQVLASPEARALLLEAAEEAAAVGRARGVALPADTAGAIAAQTRDMPPDGRPSMLEDLEAGRPLELAYLSGAVVRLGREAGVPTPFHATAHRALAMHERGRRPI